jgi:WD40 repeat protein
LASGGDDKTVILWNFELQKKVITLKGHSNFVTSVTFSPDGKYLASGSADKTVKLWSVE